MSSASVRAGDKLLEFFTMLNTHMFELMTAILGIDIDNYEDKQKLNEALNNLISAKFGSARSFLSAFFFKYLSELRKLDYDGHEFIKLFEVIYLQAAKTAIRAKGGDIRTPLEDIKTIVQEITEDKEFAEKLLEFATVVIRTLPKLLAVITSESAKPEDIRAAMKDLLEKETNVSKYINKKISE
jgi:hypothetical protein